jgi:hypothetical protein
VSDRLEPTEGTLWQVNDEEFHFATADGTRHINITCAHGEAQDATMAPETHIAYLREQLRHVQRQLEEAQALLEMRGREMSDCYATIRTLMKVHRDPLLRGI